ncbi:Ppx/GppA phosphatase family protein [Actinocorallia sp. A-T 12471]|uniref:Ppx/GppA phosphatase family protein n=1 Tax=Actinocorallia sp. A-T 12471 TaxID=3089813 RepID=UPI0029CFF06B|nr:Ppx/GppA phosphatase family protein [Actinocorallia sp. A-T 12471]MDX6740256.1 Ppx/GppA phosphatase family protein [Actinocorallia sp. A-T 12471]
MRMGVLDIGSNTVHLLVMDAHQGGKPLPAYSHKVELRLAEHLDGDRLSDEGAKRLHSFIKESLQVAEDKGVQEIQAFATSAIREAVNGEEILQWIRTDLETQIEVLSGADEARLTFLAVRRWFGWSSNRLQVFDIGGGSLEIATGIDEEPDAAVSVPLGAGRLTRAWLTADPPDPEQVRALRRHVRAEIAAQVAGFTRYGRPDHAVATSKTFKQLARIAGAAPSSEGPFVRRLLTRESAKDWADRLTRMPIEERQALPGVSEARAPQLLAGAIVADAAMDLFDIPALEVCPWALREGVILRRLDRLPRTP